MHRNDLLDLIADYRLRHADEADVIDRFENFVREHPDCFKRSLLVGHITGSAWLVDKVGQRTLLTHHRKLNKWLQFGGHADGHPDVLDVARREAYEESGLEAIEAVSPRIFDLDIHPIPARKTEPEHLHYDVRFAFRCVGAEEFTVTDESHEIAWVACDDLEKYTTEWSMVRLRDKWRVWREQLQGG